MAALLRRLCCRFNASRREAIVFARDLVGERRDGGMGVMGWMRYLELQLAWPSEVVRICRCHEWSERRAVDSGRPTLEVQVELEVAQQR